MKNRLIALAGLYQSVDLVHQIAWHGNAEPRPFDASVGSLFKLDAPNYADVYGAPEGIRSGLAVLRAQLTEIDKKPQLERTRYVVNLLSLEKKLSRDASMTATLREGLERAREQLAHFGPTHINVISQLADTYQRSISRLRPRIIVKGEQSYLANPDNASRIRVLLLAGIRAAVLWRQAGGNRWRIVFGRNALLRELESASPRAL
ncbi:MAG: high frequency lysogenization protein HflD [Gammaproteobacteria bacterium]